VTGLGDASATRVGTREEEDKKRAGDLSLSLYHLDGSRVKRGLGFGVARTSRTASAARSFLAELQLADMNSTT
jgi:hypothetical protein